MGKPRNNKVLKPSMNVFKVAGARSFKAKKKAKAVITQLKNLNEVNKLKTADVDRQFESLQEEVRQQGSKKSETTEKKGKVAERLISKDIKQCEQNERKAAETLEKLTDMTVSM